MKVNNGTFGGDSWAEEDLKNVEQPVLRRAIRRTDKRSIPFTGEGRRPRDPEDPEVQEDSEDREVPEPPKSRAEKGLPRKQPRWYPVPTEKKTAEELAAAVRRVHFKTALCGGGLAMRAFMEKKEGVAYTCPGCKDVECGVCYD
jgi:predicted RNA-binding Zn-ribbon protein involved in translation (DUF1610 family)